MKPSTVIALMVLVFTTAGVVVWIILRQTKDTLSEAGKTAAQAKGVTEDVVALGTIGKKAWDDIGKLFKYGEEQP